MDNILYIIEYKIIVDDYVGREQYHILEKFFDVEKKIGEFVVFCHKAELDIEVLKRAIKQFELIPD